MLIIPEGRDRERGTGNHFLLLNTAMICQTGKITNGIGGFKLPKASKARDNVVACGRLSLSQQSYSQWETS